MRDFLLQFFTWWNRQTLGVRFHIWRKGEFVGEDSYGNRYYRKRGGRADAALGFERRWVIYSGVSEASAIPPEWHGWMHHIVDVPPTESRYAAKSWEKPHRPNLTGTPGAYRPAGSLLTAERRPRVAGDYDAWTPGS